MIKNQKNIVYLRSQLLMPMPTKNIFAGFGVKSKFVNLIYNELMKHEFVSYADVLTLYYGRPEGYYKKYACKYEPGFGELKKAYPEVLKALESVCPGCIEDNGKSKGKAYRYIGEDSDPLAAERKAVAQKSIEDYVSFCKASASILPASWFSSFFENTQLLLDTKRETEAGGSYIRSGFEQNLTNIDLLPVFYKAISHQQVLRFAYQPFGQQQFSLVFHPQFIKEYNGRWFVFGESDKEPYHAFNIALDRVVGEVCETNDVDYIPAPKGFYQKYFQNIIGVTHEAGAKMEEVVIRTKSEYLHGLILTKPLHHSQKETLPFGAHSDGSYGEVTLNIEPNRELRGRILQYGEGLEVIEPLALREQLKTAIKKLMGQYEL